MHRSLASLLGRVFQFYFEIFVPTHSFTDISDVAFQKLLLMCSESTILCSSVLVFACLHECHLRKINKARSLSHDGVIGEHGKCCVAGMFPVISLIYVCLDRATMPGNVHLRKMIPAEPVAHFRHTGRELGTRTHSFNIV